MLDTEIEKEMMRFEKLLQELETIARKEMSGEPLSEAEYRTIWNIGATLNRIAKLDRDIQTRIYSGLNKEIAVIADVHTDTNSGYVLQEAIGRPFIIYIKIPGRKNQIAAGPVFSYYEFKQPIKNRLTDEAWQSMVKQRKVPSLPKWTKTFRAGYE